MKKLMIKKWTQVTETGVIPPLGEELVKHIERYHGTVKHASCSAWNLLFQTMQENGLPVSTVSFTDNGKPYFADSTIHFSLSHSHDLCAVTITDQPVGIDVEMVKESYNPHLVERSLSDEERTVYEGDFTRMWCRKEAVAKMTGEGINGYPDYIDTTKYQFHEELIEHKGQKYWLVVV